MISQFLYENGIWAYPLLILIGVIVVGVGLMYIRSYMSQLRIEDLYLKAESKGYSITEDRFTLKSYFDSIKTLPSIVPSGEIKFLIEFRHDGAPVHFFEYEYEMRNANSSKTKRQSVIITERPEKDFKKFVIDIYRYIKNCDENIHFAEMEQYLKEHAQIRPNFNEIDSVFDYKKLRYLTKRAVFAVHGAGQHLIITGQDKVVRSESFNDFVRESLVVFKYLSSEGTKKKEGEEYYTKTEFKDDDERTLYETVSKFNKHVEKFEVNLTDKVYFPGEVDTSGVTSRYSPTMVKGPRMRGLRDGRQASIEFKGFPVRLHGGSYIRSNSLYEARRDSTSSNYFDGFVVEFEIDTDIEYGFSIRKYYKSLFDMILERLKLKKVYAFGDTDLDFRYSINPRIYHSSLDNIGQRIVGEIKKLPEFYSFYCGSIIEVVIPLSNLDVENPKSLENVMEVLMNILDIVEKG